MEDSIGVIAAGLVLFAIVLLMAWAYDDAEQRGQSGCLVAFLILCAGLPGIIIWLLIRDGLGKRASKW